MQRLTPHRGYGRTRTSSPCSAGKPDPVAAPTAANDLGVYTTYLCSGTWGPTRKQVLSLIGGLYLAFVRSAATGHLGSSASGAQDAQRRRSTTNVWRCRSDSVCARICMRQPPIPASRCSRACRRTVTPAGQNREINAAYDHRAATEVPRKLGWSLTGWLVSARLRGRAHRRRLGCQPELGEDH